MESGKKDNNEIKDGISIWGSFMLIFLIIGIQLMVGILVSILSGVFNIESEIKNNTYVSAIANIIAYIITYKLVLKKNKVDIKFKYRFDAKIAICGVFILVGYILTSDNTVNLIIPKLISESWVNNAFTEMLKTPFKAFCLVVVIGPIFEELFMRGIILEQLSIRYKPTISITVSALLFAILHLNVTQGVNAFLSGIIFGLVYLKTRNIMISILLHVLNNFFSYIVSYFPELYKMQFSPIKLTVGVTLLVVSLYIFKGLKLSGEADKKGEDALIVG